MTSKFQDLVSRVREESFDGLKRRYHRFRFSSHDDSAVADCSGSSLRCAHEWGWCEGVLDRPSSGRLYSPAETAERLEDICREKGVSRVRLSGMEPVMGDRHLPELVRVLDEGLEMCVDTNGMLLTEEYLAELVEKRSVSIRLSFKGSNPENFAQLSGVEPRFFRNQLRVFKACVKRDVDVVPVLAGVYGRKELEELREMLRDIDEMRASELYVEKLHLCPENREKLVEAGFDLGDVLEE